jgi:hypothetical protein
MFAFFGLGIQEILLLGVIGVAIAVVVFIIARVTTGGSPGFSDPMAALEEDNRRLRAELDELRDQRDRPA